MAKRNPLDKRKDETDLQWRSRLARAQETARRQGEDVITPERRSHGDLEEVGAKQQGMARTYRKRTTSSLLRLQLRGVITKDQLAAAQEIALMVERYRREVRGSSGALGEQVDCSGSAFSFGDESLHRVCMERAYTAFRDSLPQPRALVLDMVWEDNKLAAIARSHGRSWVKALEVLKDALDAWPEYRREAFNSIDQDDVDAMNEKAA